MKKDKRKEKSKAPAACPVLLLENPNELFIISQDNWNTQDSRTFIMNADFRQMDSAKDKR
ncbi:hypothetical protein [Maridesulfovibrio sp.]|uniref:hypothetical protein n=1 Tax=Maridesulfovibrio sp. TaxID=2795000 RepID=UPI002A18AC8A|nr:hypothetical protein [Maridesulfovibrio sp.]